MSVGTHSTEPETYRCAYCDGERDPDASVRGSYCSRDCWLASKGAAVLDQIESDHTRCATCFRARKDVENPPDRWLRDKERLIREAAIGFEYPTEHLRDGPGFRFCECGCVEHRAEHEVLQQIEPTEVALNLLDCLLAYYDSEQIDERPSGGTLGRALRETEFDLDVSIGRAVYDS